MEKWFGDTNCFKVCEDEEQGRFVVATRDVAKDEVVHLQYPYAWAVFEEWKENTCRFCMGFINESPDIARKCRQCLQVYYCSRACQKSDSREHLIHECKILSLLFPKDGPQSTIPVDYCMELKILLRIISRKRVESLSPKDENPTSNIISWDRECIYEDFQQLVANKDKFDETVLEAIRYWVTNYAHSMGEYIYNNANTVYQNRVQVETKDELENIACKCRLNAFAYGNGLFDEPQGYGIYIKASLFNHSCSPNVVLRTLPPDGDGILSLLDDKKSPRSNPSGPLVVFTAAKCIKKGEMLTVSYLDNGMMEPGLLNDDKDAFGITDEERQQFSLSYRRRELRDNYLFHCNCIRCKKEENELNNNTSIDENISKPNDEEKKDTCEEIDDKEEDKESEKEVNHFILKDTFQELLGKTVTIKTLRGKVKFTILGFSAYLDKNQLQQVALVKIDGKDDTSHVPLKHILEALENDQ